MQLNTAAAVIGFAKKLEQDSARFYEAVAEKFNTEEATYLAFAKENRRHVSQVERTYYGVISDVLEGCFSFLMEADEYTSAGELPGEIDYGIALKMAVEIESKIEGFYTEAARQSKALMADVPRVFELTAKKHSKRKQKLEELEYRTV